MNNKLKIAALFTALVFGGILAERRRLDAEGHLIEIKGQNGAVDVLVNPNHKVADIHPATIDERTVLTSVETVTPEQLKSWPKMAEQGRAAFLGFVQENRNYFKNFRSADGEIRNASIENLTSMAEVARDDFSNLEKHTPFITDFLGKDGIAIAIEKRARLEQILTGLQHAAEYKATLAALDAKPATPEPAR